MNQFPSTCSTVLFAINIPISSQLLMEDILHHLGCIKPCEQWDKLPINWCRISSINRINWCCVAPRDVPDAPNDQSALRALWRRIGFFPCDMANTVTWEAPPRGAPKKKNNPSDFWIFLRKKLEKQTSFDDIDCFSCESWVKKDMVKLLPISSWIVFTKLGVRLETPRHSQGCGASCFTFHNVSRCKSWRQKNFTTTIAGDLTIFSIVIDSKKNLEN